jgi:hypothetical protein
MVQNQESADNYEHSPRKWDPESTEFVIKSIDGDIVLRSTISSWGFSTSLKDYPIVFDYWAIIKSALAFLDPTSLTFKYEKIIELFPLLL